MPRISNFHICMDIRSGVRVASDTETNEKIKISHVASLYMKLSKKQIQRC